MYTIGMRLNLDIFTYSDYRTYLREYYNAAKEQVPGFSFQLWAQKAGFASPSFIKLIIEGRRELTGASAAKIARSVGLKGKEVTYFKRLAEYHRAQTISEKMHNLSKIDQYRTSDTPRDLRGDEYRYLENWFNPLITEMVELPDFNMSPAQIQHRSAFPIRVKDIQAALQFLVTAGYLYHDAKGRLRKKDRTIRARNEGEKDAMALAVRKYHITMLQYAQKAVALLPLDDRYIADTTLSFSHEGYTAAIERIRQCRFELLALAAADQVTEEIYQLNVVFFPLTRKPRLTGNPRRDESQK
jgi:uncharacterized protein (TIGR02147 family)